MTGKLANRRINNFNYYKYDEKQELMQEPIVSWFLILRSVKLHKIQNSAIFYFLKITTYSDCLLHHYGFNLYVQKIR